MADGAFEVAFELPTTGASELQYIRVDDGVVQQGYILSVLRAGLGVSGVLHEILDLIPKPEISIAYRKVVVLQHYAFVFSHVLCAFPFLHYHLALTFTIRSIPTGVWNVRHSALGCSRNAEQRWAPLPRHQLESAAVQSRRECAAAV